jgi:hypothetical protein
LEDIELNTLFSLNRKVAAFAIAATAALTTLGAHAADMKEIRFGVEASYAPFESKSPGGELIGFDIDVGNAVCAKLKVKCVWVENSFDGLIPALQARKFDGINSDMSITDKRRTAIDFTDPAGREEGQQHPADCGEPEGQARRRAAGLDPGDLREGQVGASGRRRAVVSGAGPDLCGRGFRAPRRRVPGCRGGVEGLS